MKTRFNYISDDWVRVKNHCRTTVNKDFTNNEPGEKFKRQLLISEHSPIRLLEIDWSWEDVYSWVATHWSRHKFEKFISTQRSDRTETHTPRGELRQDALVRFDGYANMQNLIDAFRKRLCYQASPETRELAEDFKMALHETHPEMADVLVPNCVYRSGCPEFQSCGWFEWYVTDDGCTSTDIQKRYDMYNWWFYAKHAAKKIVFDNEQVAITGTFSPMSRREIEEAIRSLGGHIKGTVDSETTILVVGENAGSKVGKAK